MTVEECKVITVINGSLRIGFSQSLAGSCHKGPCLSVRRSDSPCTCQLVLLALLVTAMSICKSGIRITQINDTASMLSIC